MTATLSLSLSLWGRLASANSRFLVSGAVAQSAEFL